MLNKNLSKIIIYVSLTFLLIYLYNSGYLIKLEIHNYFVFFVSLVLLVLGFIFQSLAWYKTVYQHDNDITKSTAIVSEFLSIFAKYIPGKVLMILGPASYITENSRINLKNSSFYALQVQILNLWIGMIIGSFVLFYINITKEWIYLLIVCEVFMSLFLFSKSFHNIFLVVIKKLFKKNVHIPLVSANMFKSIVPYIFFRWIFWVVGFSLLITSLTEIEFNLNFGFGFVLAGVLGVMALVAPGGIGVREGILVMILSLLGLSIDVATSISIASRIWFIIGEIIVFVIGFVFLKLEGAKK